MDNLLFFPVEGRGFPAAGVPFGTIEAPVPSRIYDDIRANGWTVYQQGTAPKQMPETFVTVWQDFSGDILYADNKAIQCRHEWTLVFYTKDATKIFSGLQAVIKALKKRGYSISGQGYDVGGAWEGYDARAVDVVKIEDLED